MRVLLPFFLVLILVACGNETENTSATTTNKAFTYKLDFQEYTDRELNCGGDECTEVKIILPQLRGGDSLIAAEVNKKIEDQYRQLIKSRLPEPRSTGSWESLASAFIEGFELFKMEFPDDPTSWYLYLDGVESVLVGDSIFTAIIEDREFMGGAHGNSATLIESYSLTDGMRIDVVERYGPKLKQLANEKFRLHHGISSEEDLNDAGFIFPEEGFILPDNIGYTSKGLMLIYNPYEVAPYSIGATVLSISISELEDKKESV